MPQAGFDMRGRQLDAGVGEMRDVCKARDVVILKGHISREHVHIFVSVLPQLSISELMMSIKGLTSRKILMEFKTLNRQVWGRHFWTRGYFVASSGNITDKRNISNSKTKNLRTLTLRSVVIRKLQSAFSRHQSHRL